MPIIDMPGWIVHWLSICHAAPAAGDLVWPPAGPVVATRVGLFPLLWLCAATAALAFAALSWVRRGSRRSSLGALVAAAVLIPLFMLALYRAFIARDTIYDTMNGNVFLFAGAALRDALISGVLLGVSALVLRVSHNRAAQGVLLGLSVLTVALLTAAWGAFAWAEVCTT